MTQLFNRAGFTLVWPFGTRGVKYKCDRVNYSKFRYCSGMTSAYLRYSLLDFVVSVSGSKFYSLWIKKKLYSFVLSSVLLYSVLRNGDRILRENDKRICLSFVHRNCWKKKKERNFLLFLFSLFMK